jgi:hypothetical protein
VGGKEEAGLRSRENLQTSIAAAMRYMGKKTHFYNPPARKRGATLAVAWRRISIVPTKWRAA